MVEHEDEPVIEGEQASTATFDLYRSLTYPNLMIFVAKDVVPPFRFKAGGWELLRSTALGPAMKTRIVEKGYFLCRLNDEGSGWSEMPIP